MENRQGGQDSWSRQRQTATELARKKVLEAYKRQPQDYKVPTEASPTPKATSEDWRKYHSAWQDYYQKYYGEYYGRAARDYVARERLRLEREAANGAQAAPIEQIQQQKTQDNFRARIQDTAKKRAKKMRKSKHFVPLLLGGTIILLGVLLQYNQTIAAHIVAYLSPTNTEVNEITAIDPTIAVDVHDSPTLMIPKLNVEVPVVFGAGNSVEAMNTAMSNGVAHYSISGASAKPGEIGNFVISGHSAGNIYQQSNYKFIFSGLTRMAAGDLAYMDYNGVRYTYRITGTRVVEPTDVQALIEIANDNDGVPMMTLITCTPLGTSKQRLLVYGEQISPSYENASTAAPSTGETSGEIAMPANQPTPLEQFWKWLTGQN